MLQIVDEELMAVLVARVAEALHGLILKKSPLISEAAKFQLVRPHVLGEIPGGNARRPGLQHQDRETTLRDFFGYPAATGSRTDHQHVKHIFPRNEHAADSLAKVGHQHPRWL